jgi:hypothetical protein
VTGSFDGTNVLPHLSGVAHVLQAHGEAHSRAEGGQTIGQSGRVADLQRARHSKNSRQN